MHDSSHAEHPAENFHQADSSPTFSHHEENIKGAPVILSKYTRALLKSWKTGAPKTSLSPNKISVSQSVSFLAFVYEKMRNAVEFREEHLIRRAAIERIIKRRMLLNENGRDIADLLIKELLWARYYENNTLGEEKVIEVQGAIDKYFYFRNEMCKGRSRGEQDRIASFVLEVLSCEIEEILSPDLRREAFTNFVYQLTRHRIAPFNGREEEKDIQVYIAVERAFAHSDDPLIRYHLLKLMIPEIVQVTWQTGDTVLGKMFDVYLDIEKSLKHPFRDKVRGFLKKQSPPFFILQDIFQQNPQNADSILSDEEKLKNKVDEACRRRYEETKSRLRRTGIRSFIYIVLTKVVFAILLELPYDRFISGSVAYIPLIVNILFPPILMAIIILSVTVPGDENTRKIFNLILGILTQDPDDPEYARTAVVIGKIHKGKTPIYSYLFSLIYLAAYLVTFGTIISVLTRFEFNPVSQTIFIFFVTLVTFFAYKVTSITGEYLVIDKEGPLTPFFDFFFIPIVRVGQWLSGEVLTKFNLFTFIFDFIIEMPLKAVVEIIDEWVRFVRLKKEEIV